MTRSGIAAGLPLVLALIAIRVLSSYEKSDGNPIAVGATVAGVVVLIVATPGVVLLINRRRLVGARDRKLRIDARGDIRWLADVTLDTHSQKLFGVIGIEKARTFALVLTPQALELWATPDGPSASIGRSEIRHVEATPISWAWNSVSAIVLEQNDSGEPVVMDVVGPVLGTLPATRVQQEFVVDAVTSAHP